MDIAFNISTLKPKPTSGIDHEVVALIEYALLFQLVQLEQNVH